MITLKDIARLCGVSPAAVSKALNGQSDIGEETAGNIRAVAKKLGYHPNAAARALKTKRSQNIGVLFVDPSRSGLRHEYFSVILDNLKIEAERLGYDVTFISRNIGVHSMTYSEHTRYRGCDGVIIASVDFEDPEVIELVKSRIPTVTLDYIFEGHSAILSDNVCGMANIVEYLVSRGQRDIAIIHGEDTEVTRKRLHSFWEACKREKLEIRPECVRAARFHDPEGSQLATRELLRLPQIPGCIIYPDDFSCIGGLNELEAQGLTVPDDMSVVGYDGINLARLMKPRLTTWRQDAETLGREAANTLVAEIEGTIQGPRYLNVPGEFWPGETVRAI